MKLLERINSFLTEVFRIATSRERLEDLLGISLYRNALYLIMNAGVTAILGFVFWIVAARLYSDEDVGLASAAIAAAGLLALLSTLGLDYGLIRFLPHSGEKHNAMINSCFTIGGLVAIVLALLFLAGLEVWSPALIFLRQNPIFLCAFVAFTAASTLLAILRQTFVAERKTGFTLAQGILFALLKLALVASLAAFFHTFGIFASWGIGVVVAVITSIFLFLPRVQTSYRPFLTIRREVVNEMVHFSSANYAAVLLWGAPSLLLPLMVVNLLGAEPNAYFYIAWAIGGILFAIPTSISLSLFAEGSYDEEKLSRDTRRSLKFTILLLVPAILLMFLIGDKLLLVFGEAYSENATRLLWILAISALPLSLNHVYFGIKRVKMEMKSVIGFTAPIAIVTLALSYILLPRIGILGAGVAWLASQGIVSLMVVHDLWRILHGQVATP